MRLKRVRLYNIRQFLGEQEVVFSVNPEKKVTLFQAPNATGKTTLLNAVFWCLYGDFLTGFDEKERLKSQESDELEYWIEVEFEHNERTYIARRQGEGDPKDAKFRVMEIAHAGQAPIIHPQPDLLVNRILPQSLADFFFFAGEYLKQSVPGKYSALAADSIRAVLGFKLAEQTIEDIKEVRKKKQKVLRTLSAGTDLARISTELEVAEAVVERERKTIKEARELLGQLEESKRHLSDLIRGFESSSVLQERREIAESKRKKAERELAESERDRQEIVGRYGQALLLSKVARDAKQFINESVTHKRIPSPFDKTFVKDILQSQSCVCGRPLALGSEEYKAIARLVNSATDEAVLKGALSVRGISERILSEASTGIRRFKEILLEHGRRQQALVEAEQELAAIREKLKKHQEQSVREREVELENVENRIKEEAVRRSLADRSLSEALAQVEKGKREMERVQALSPQVEEAKEGLALVEGLLEFLEEELSKEEKRGLEKITGTLNAVVGSATRQKYSAELSEEYNLRLYRMENDGTKVAVHSLSSGERRLLNLCFMSALVDVCRQREIDTDSVVLPGAVAPMMVDAPFGELDPEYQALAATVMAQLADQLILLLSKTHYTEEVKRAISDKVGKEYGLFGYKRDAAGTATPVYIEVQGQRIEQIIYGAERDWTEIKDLRGTT